MFGSKSRIKSQHSIGQSGVTLDHLVKGWFPCSRDHLVRIRRRLRDGSYSSGEKLLVEDLKGDLSLLAYSLRNSSSLNDGRISRTNPLEALCTGSPENLSALFEIKPSVLSEHRFSRADPAQVHLMIESVRMCTVAEELAIANGACGETAFCCTALRQLAPILFAWNHPKLFSKSVRAARAREIERDEATELHLGVSRLPFAERLAYQWHLTPSLGGSLAFRGSDSISSLEQPLELSGICNLAEAYVDVCREDSLAKGDRRTIIELLHTRFGVDGWDTIKRKVEDKAAIRCESYREIHRILALRLPNSIVGGDHPKIREMLIQNPFVVDCPGELQNEFAKIYRLLTPNEMSAAAIDRLSVSVLPLADFSSAELLSLEPHSAQFVPLITLGSTSSRYLDKDRMFKAALHGAFTAGAEHLDGYPIPHRLIRLDNDKETVVLFLEGPGPSDARGEQVVRAIGECLRACIGWPFLFGKTL